ncbi:hypothetical protein DERP_003934 [Dermatophagoides pteronyssinus]|uniref:Uncharacterized protein n=1 Tax=Dermatophagoides pteronyssinus TaxID=6956 RepID=A0ABQ8J7N6_DERPT|nr:hypothetical protein DERP_003934 [Dermatophagoides pteronyssinus]
MHNIKSRELFLAETLQVRQLINEVLPAPDGPSNAFKLFIRMDPLRRFRIIFCRFCGLQPFTKHHSSIT